MGTLAVKDANGTSQTVYTLPAPGRVGAVGSSPVVLSNEDLTALQAIATAMGATLSINLPTGASTSANQTAQTTAIGTIGTRAYQAPLTRVTVGSSSSASAAITATEVLLHPNTRCFVRAGAAATSNDIPLEAGEKFHMRITSGTTINVIQDSAGGYLNIVPVM